MNAKHWFRGCILIIGICLICMMILTIMVDPLFHYRAPSKSFKYSINNERYQNDGIVRHFDYNALITGTSMTENFKTSELDALFDVKSIKVPFSGGSYKEIGSAVRKAAKEQKKLRYVIWGLDYGMMANDKDSMRYLDYPTYLYDDNLLNDVNYWFNKEIFIRNTARVLYNTLLGEEDMDFDTAHRWNEAHTFGKETVDETYQRSDKSFEQHSLLEEDRKRIEENINQNVLSIVKDYPEVNFYLFFPPYSIYYWDSCNQSGTLNYQLEVEKTVIEMLVPYENVFLFSFTDNFELITNLDNYKDSAHYSADVNSEMLKWMKRGDYQLTQDNYQEYCMRIKEYLTNYDYDSMFQ